jgi:hypothetical protein
MSAYIIFWIGIFCLYGAESHKTWYITGLSAYGQATNAVLAAFEPKL